MTLQCPDYIRKSGIVGAPLNFKWNDDIAMDHIEGDENPRLYRAVDECSFKAKMAIDALLTEWILWRFEGHTQKALQRGIKDTCKAAEVVEGPTT